MRPQRILWFFLALVVSLASIAVLFDGTRITIGQQTVFRFPSFGYDVIPSDSTLTILEHDADTMSFLDTNTYEAMVIDSSRWYPQSLVEVHGLRIELPSLDYLNPFFESLDSVCLKEEVARILYFGDSQIEGDRITSSLRHYLQLALGGHGPGLIPWHSKVSFGAYDFEIEATWLKRHILTDPDDRHLGLYMGYWQGLGSMRFKPSLYYPYKERQGFVKVSMLGEHLENIELHADQKKLFPSVKTRQSEVEKYEFQSPQTAQYLDLKSVDSSRCYALFLDGQGGIACDNLPLRGSSGYIFAKLNSQYLSAMAELTHTRLIVLQFGVNALSTSLEPMSNLKAIEARLLKELKALQRAVPEIPIVMISISDRAVKQGSNIVSNPNARALRDVQRRVCRKTGCAFWDLYEAMGGQGAIQHWVDAQWAGKDYVHFTAKGAERVGQMFYKSLIEDYIYFLYRSPQNKSLCVSP